MSKYVASVFNNRDVDKFYTPLINLMQNHNNKHVLSNIGLHIDQS